MTPETSIERFTDALTATARPNEVAAESEVVSHMAGLAAPTTGVAVIIKTIIGHKVAAAAAAVVLGTTTAAAASGNVPFIQDETETEVPEVVEEATEPISTTITTQAVNATVEEIDDTAAVEEEIDESEVQPPVDDAGEPYGDVDCDDAENHGEYVSSVAHDDSIEGNKGEIVSQAAKTSCGKHTSDDKDTDDKDTDDKETHNIDDDDEISGDDETHDDNDDARGNKKPDHDKHNNGNGNGNGNKKDR